MIRTIIVIERLARREPTAAAIRFSIREKSILNVMRIMGNSTLRKSTINTSLSMTLNIARALTVIMVIIGMRINRNPTRERLEQSHMVQRFMVEVPSIKVMGITITRR